MVNRIETSASRMHRVRREQRYSHQSRAGNDSRDIEAACAHVADVLGLVSYLLGAAHRYLGCSPDLPIDAHFKELWKLVRTVHDSAGSMAVDQARAKNHSSLLPVLQYITDTRQT